MGMGASCQLQRKHKKRACIEMLPRFKIQYPMKNQYKDINKFAFMQYYKSGIFHFWHEFSFY
jgi:hypothetical protein